MEPTTRFMNWLGDRIVQRIATLLAGWIAARTEANILDAHVDMLSELEDQARRLESEGKDQLAAWLRSSSQEISLEAPARTALDVVEHLANADIVAGLPQPEDADPTEETKPSENPAPSGRRGGRPKKSTAHSTAPEA